MSFSATNITAFHSTVYVGLGSNLEQPILQIKRALQELDEIPEAELICVSSFYQTAPVGILDQPPFINVVAEMTTTLAPQALLAHFMAIEAAHARARLKKNGPRTLDLDILIFNEWRINEVSLVIPHPRMHERAFVLIPLLEIAPDVYIPGKGFAKDWLDKLDLSGVQLLAA